MWMLSCQKYVAKHFLRSVHTKDDNYKDNDKDVVLKIVLNIKRTAESTSQL